MTASHDEFRANFSIAVPIDEDEPENVTGVTSSGDVRHVDGEREGVRETESAMDGRGPRGW